MKREQLLKLMKMFWDQDQMITDIEKVISLKNSNSDLSGFRINEMIDFILDLLGVESGDREKEMNAWFGIQTGHPIEFENFIRVVTDKEKAENANS